MQFLEMIMTASAGICVFCMMSACCADDSSREDDYIARRAVMVRQLRDYGVKDQKTLAAMEIVPRHVFIPENFRRRANPYGDHPCPIGFGHNEL